MEQSVSKTKDTVELSNKTDEAISSIYMVIDDIAKMNTQVSTAVEEQATVASEVALNISNISTAFDETTSSDVRQMTVELTQLAGGFNI